MALMKSRGTRRTRPAQSEEVAAIRRRYYEELAEKRAQYEAEWEAAKESKNRPTRLKDLVHPGRPHGEGGEPTAQEEFIRGEGAPDVGEGFLNEDDPSNNTSPPSETSDAVEGVTPNMPPAPNDERGQVVIPNDWTKLDGTALKELASKFADEGTQLNKRQQAVAVINAELDRRAQQGV